MEISVTHAATRRLHFSDSALLERSMLSQMRRAHHALVAQIANMESLTVGIRYEPAACMAGRWKISQASLARRVLSARICDYLLARRGPHETERLLALRHADRDLLRLSAGHVANWSPQAIGVDWRGYCAASCAIRMRMRKQIFHEESVLYPLLGHWAEPMELPGNGASDGTRTRDLRRDRPAL